MNPPKRIPVYHPIPSLWARVQRTITWGVLLAALAIYGVGRWAFDTPLRAWLEQK
jgi:hypothetical protein